MSTMFDDTAEDVPVRDISVNLSRFTAAPQDSSVCQNARGRQDISRLSRDELEDWFLRLQEETLLLKQHIHKQDDKIKRLGTKLMRLVKDRGRLEQLAVGGAQLVSRVRDVEMEEMLEELQEKVRALHTEKEGLKQRLLVVKQQLINSRSRRPSPYGHVPSRVNSGLKKQRDETPSPSQTLPKSTRSLEGGGRPPVNKLPRYGHSLLEDARAEIRNLENVIESQRSHMEEMEEESALLREGLKKLEAEYEERLLQVREQQSNRLRSHVNENVVMIRMQKELTERSTTVTDLEGRFLQLQESQRTLKASHDAAMLKVDELSAQLKDERLKSLDLEKQLQSSTISKIKMEQLQQQMSELEQEKDLLRRTNEKLVNSAFDVTQQQKWQIQQQQLKLQIAQLEAALKADLTDKNEILDKIKAERETNEKLTEENKKLHIQFLEQKQQTEELSERLKVYSRGGEYDVAELTEALLLIKSRGCQERGELGFLQQVEVEVGGSSTHTESSVRELRATHAETIEELEKTRNLLSVESKISKNLKAELDTVLQKINSDRVEYQQKLERQAQLLDAKTMKIKKLEAQLRDIAYGTRTYALRADVTNEDEADKFDEALHLQRGENQVELQIVSAMLSPSALQALGDGEPCTFCTYAFYLFEAHSTPIVTGHRPSYGFTSKYVVSMDNCFLDYLNTSSVTVELHQALGLDWRTLGTGQIRLRQLLEQDGKVHGTVPLVGSSVELQSLGSVDYCLRLRIPMTETIHLYKDKMKAVGFISTALDEDAQLRPSSSSWNELSITVHRCRDLQSRSSRHPSPYVIYRFFHFCDYPTATVHDSWSPHFSDLKTYCVLMDEGLDQYLRSEVLQLYVFDYKEEQMDAYLGKATVPLLSLAQDEGITGEFELTDPSGLSAGHIEVTLKWKVSYLRPSGSIRALEECISTAKPSGGAAEQQPERGLDTETKDKLSDRHVAETLQEKEDRNVSHQPVSVPDVSTCEALKLKQKSPVMDGLTVKKVKFRDPSVAGDQVEDRSPSAPSMSGSKTTASPVMKVESDVTPEDDEDESHFSEGQLDPSSTQSCSDESDISEEIIGDADTVKQDQSEANQSDSDDCVVHGRATGRKPSERVRVEVVALTLKPGSGVARDSSVMRLFVEYSFLDLPTEETPLSLPKPPQGRSISFNYSKVFPVDAESNNPRRRLLKKVLQGQNPAMDRIRFTVVSEPPEEEEQDRECEDVGVAFLRLTDILERQQDLIETSLNVVDVVDSSEVIGSLTVSVEGLEVFQSLMEDQDLDSEPAPTSLLLPTSAGGS